MASYFIGDIQGCFDEFSLLLAKINFEHGRDSLFLTGDLIGRGPKALATLEYVTAHPDSIQTVLGNHDLHFLAISRAIKSAKPSDKFDQLLASPKLDYFVDYLRTQPLLIAQPEHQLILTHAGLSPQWNLSSAKQAALEVEHQLQQPDFSQLLQAMYNNQPNNWFACDSPQQRWIYTINALTRMRYCFNDGSLDFIQNCPPSELKVAELVPWFSLENASLDKTRVVFGHWASLLGHTNHANAIALDTGCLWGNELTAWCLETDQKIVQPALN